MLPISNPQCFHTGSELWCTSSAHLVVGRHHWRSRCGVLCWCVHSGAAGILVWFHVHVWVGVQIWVVVSVQARILAVFVVAFRVDMVLMVMLRSGGHVINMDLLGLLVSLQKGK